MTQIYPTIRTVETVEYGFCDRGLIMEPDNKLYRLTAGTTDSLHVFQAGSVFYVLTINRLLEYVALDYYIGSEGDPVDSVFLQGDYVIRECVGSDWRSLSLTQITTRLMELFA